MNMGQAWGTGHRPQGVGNIIRGVGNLPPGTLFYILWLFWHSLSRGPIQLSQVTEISC